MLNFRSPLSNQIGYGIAAFEIAKALYSLGEDLIYWNIGQPQVEPVHALMVQGWANNQSKYNRLDNTFTVWHQNALHERIGRGINGALTFFEKNVLSDWEIESLNTQDLIFAPSLWAHTLIKNDTRFKTGLVHLPMGVDTELFQPGMAKKEIDTYTFLNVGKIEVRKGHDILADLFSKAFTKDDDVELVVSWENPFLTQDEKKKWIDKYRSSKLGDKIKFIDRQPNRQSMAVLYNYADCGIFPTRAEGCGLPIMEMLACGKPIITTNYSAHTDFCTEDNSMLVEIDKLEKCYDGKWFHGEGNWASIGIDQEEQFIEYMQKCYKMRYSFNYQGRQDMLERPWTKTAQIILDSY